LVRKTVIKRIVIVLIISLVFIFSLNALTKTEVYFSLYDDPEAVIIKNIAAAEEFISIAMYTFTDIEIAQAILKAKDRGIDIKIYLDRSQVKAKYSRSRYFIQNGIEVRISSNNYIVHNKFAIIDGKIVITVSYKWTFSANNRNDENLIVIDDPELIEIFQNQFVNLWTNKYSLERTQQLYKRAKLDFLPTSPTPTKPEDKVININSVLPEELTNILQISESFAQKIITLRNELGGFKNP